MELEERLAAARAAGEARLAGLRQQLGEEEARQRAQLSAVMDAALAGHCAELQV